MQVNSNGTHDDLSATYPEDSIGRLMTAEFVAARPEFTVAEALSHIRLHGKECETLNTIYVVDMQGSLIDEIDLSKIVLASLDILSHMKYEKPSFSFVFATSISGIARADVANDQPHQGRSRVVGETVSRYETSAQRAGCLQVA